ncbi:uncharacterized protein ARMOST_16461 [Armillaria ostoyae]|uniref:F-box domain-containing protein n=1 Tax=Armillaria ostoyae TaxID=47428 RepID=A0A284RWB3_ARMOS|nr:uncharacterized protein ARMOST_16461 [Armillaria ostoyae]
MSYPGDCGSINLPLESWLKAIQGSDSLVSQILRGSRPLLDSDHSLLSAEIVELEQQQPMYDAQLQEIQLRRCALLEALKSRKSIYAPIRRLPRDILIEIFHSVCDSWWQEADEDWGLRHRRHSLAVSGPLWVLGRVCGLWRHTLHASPASWARKLVVQAPFSKYAPEILQTYLEHTGEHLLNLEVCCSNPVTDDKILSLLVQSCQRWKNLRIIATKQHMRHFKSMSQFPALQTIDIEIYDGYDYHSDMCLGAPQLWQASLRGHGIHQIKLPPGITHFSGYITCLEDFRLLAELPNLRRCHLVMRLATKEVPVVTIAQLTHLYVDGVDVLNVLSAPLLSSLTINRITQGPRSSSTQEYITRFLHRSRCHLESLSVGKAIFTSATPSRVFALEACSTISRLKLELPPRMINIVEALTSPSVLPNLHHLILCLSQHSEDEWTTILHVVRSRRDAGLLKLVEVQFKDEYDYHLDSGDIRTLIRDDHEMRVEKWNPPHQDHWYLLDQPSQVFFQTLLHINKPYPIVSFKENFIANLALAFDQFSKLPETLEPTMTEVIKLVGHSVKSNAPTDTKRFNRKDFKASLDRYPGTDLTFDMFKTTIAQFLFDALQAEVDLHELETTIETTFTHLKEKKEKGVADFSKCSSEGNSSWEYRAVFAIPLADLSNYFYGLVTTIKLEGDHRPDEARRHRGL